MSFEPQKLFIGLVDFFSVLMPGAVVAFLGKDWVAGQLPGKDVFPLEGLEAWLIFFFASYLLGHFIFLLGTLLDEAFYDPLRRLTYWGQVRQLAREEELSSGFWRKLPPPASSSVRRPTMR